LKHEPGSKVSGGIDSFTGFTDYTGRTCSQTFYHTNYHETIEHHVQTCFILFRACIALYSSKIDSAQTPVAVAQGLQGNAKQECIPFGLI
jgi:hypothetical protein